MNKIASLVKEAEVRGVLAGLVDGGHLKIASVEDLEALTEAVSGAVEGYDYDLNTILSKTAEVIEAQENEGQDKEASEDEVDETAVMAAFGELSMMKMAGEIDEDSFEKEASKLKAMLEGAKAVGSKVKGAAAKAKELPGKAKDSAKNFKDTFTGKARDEYAMKGALEDGYLGKLKDKKNQMIGSRALVGGTALLGGNALYKKYKK